MPNQVVNKFKIHIAVFLVAVLILNIPYGQGTDRKSGENGGIGDSRILTDEEVEELGLEPPTREPTRSEPWNQWKRYGYHRGGEGGAAVYHAEHNGIYVYGGGYRTQQGHNAYDDLFFFDLSTEKWRAIERYSSPGGRYAFSSAYDEAGDKLYIYGGFFQGSEANDLWEFNFTSMQWNRLNSGVFSSPSVRRVWAPMVVDPSGKKLYIHMGQGDSTENHDNLTGFYSIDLENPTLQPLSLKDGTDQGLIERYAHDMCIDPDERKIYLYGGYNRVQGYLNEMWVYNIRDNNWEAVPLFPEIPSLYGAKMFYRPADATVNLWGGRIGSSNYENTILWTYNTELSSWSNTTFADPPSGRLLYHNHYSSEADRFAVFAGRYYGQPSRYRDMNYLDLSTMTWTQFENEYFPGSTSNGIFTYNNDQQRLYYIGPLSNTGWGGNGTEYVYYWDLQEKEWIGPYYNNGDDLPQSRSNAGICYDEANNTVYLYGGGYTTGWGSNREYHDLSDMYKLDLDTYDWELVFASAGPGERQGFDMEFNPNDGNIYFYGGYQHPTTASEIEIYNDFWKFDPELKIFSQMSLTGTTPNGRRGAATCIVEESNIFYLYGGEENTSPNPTERRDLWKYDFTAATWTKLGQTSSTRVSAELDFDPLTKELYLTGGGTDDIYRYRILENEWYLWYPVPNPGTLSGGHASIFIPEDRDLWVFGGGAKDGIWKIGIPPRMAIQTATFEDPEDGNSLAYAMYESYTFRSRIKVVNGQEDMERITFELPHRNGNFKIIYNRTQDEAGNDPWTEIDPDDYATQTSDPTISWDGLFATFTFKIMFHWNWSHKGNAVDRIFKVTAYGNVVDGDQLIVRDFLRVRNDLEFHGDLSISGAIQGELESGDWVQTGEMLSVTGPTVVYTGTTDVYPPEGTYDLKVYFNGEFRKDLEFPPGEQINFTISAENRTFAEVMDYILNISGIDKEPGEESAVSWKLNFDGKAPGEPEGLMAHADSFDDPSINYDNDRDVFVNWAPSEETGSGVMTYYWSFEDNGRTRDGTPINKTQFELELPSTGINTIYVWAEDQVGNIGDAASTSILIDVEGIEFTVVSPDLNGTIPYTTIDMVFNITDIGGSNINNQMVEYRFTYNGQADQMWIGSDAWKAYTDLWDQENFRMSYQFTISIGVDTLKLSDSDENFIQIRAKDGAGSTYTSPIYNIKVDTSLRFPEVTLISPEDGATFDDAEDITLSWEVDFFDPQDVVYNLYISDVKEKVQNQEGSIKEEVLDTEYQPNWLYLGEYFWTVVPVAKGQWTGTCLSGIWSLEITNEANFDFDVTGDEESQKYQQGAEIPFDFTLTNKGQQGAAITPSADLKGVARVTEWYGNDIDTGDYILKLGSSLDVYATVKILDNAPVGTYHLEFFFLSEYGVNRSVNVTVDIIERVDQDDDVGGDEDGQMAIYIAFAIVGLIALMMIIGALYFMVFKKKKKGPEALDRHLEELDKELEEPLTEKDEFSVAPAPTGLRSKVTGESGTGPESEGEVPKEEGEVPKEESQPVTLADEGAEDDWMNLVANETKAIEGQSDIEEDKAKHSEGKSLQDILAEMSSGVEDEEP
ncbi:MAG: kelch repeat-containing protein [Thermoplasmatota archaeon]